MANVSKHSSFLLTSLWGGAILGVTKGSEVFGWKKEDRKERFG